MSNFAEYTPGRMGTRDANNGVILPEDFDPADLAARNDGQVARDDLGLWLTVYCARGAYSHMDGVGTTDEIEARHSSDSEADLWFRGRVERMRELLPEKE